MSEEQAPAMTTADKVAALKSQKEALDRQERTTGSSGAISLEPKQSLFRADDLVKDNPDKKFRWVNVGVPEKVQGRQAQGYSRVPVAEGGRQVGNLALFETSRQAYEERVAQHAKLNQDRLSAHKTEVEKAAESIARELRDRHGIKADAARIFIKE